MKHISTGIYGLDEILNGGFLRPSTVLIAGTAGTGKTTFVIQSLFNAAKKGDICMYITSLSEPIEMLNSFMSKFEFYDISLIDSKNISYVSIDSNVINKGYEAILEKMEKNIDKIEPDRIVIDPINAFTLGMNKVSRREFYFSFFNVMKHWNSIILLTGEYTQEKLSNSIVGYLADGIIYLSNENFNKQDIHRLNVIKMRGTNFHKGSHSYKITSKGFNVFPKLHPVERRLISRERVSTGIKGLDEMTSGGYLKGSSILISGSSGTGKTIIGTQFIVDGLAKNKRGMIISYEEDISQIKDNSKNFNWKLEKYEKNKLLKIVSPQGFDAYELAIKIHDIVKQTKIEYLLFDGISKLEKTFPRYIEFSEYMDAIIKSLKSGQVTAIYTYETTDLTGDIQITGKFISAEMDMIILLKYIEINSEMKKSISVLKMRGSNHDKKIREFSINEKGIDIKLPFIGFSNLLTGAPIRSPIKAFEKAFKK